MKKILIGIYLLSTICFASEIKDAESLTQEIYVKMTSEEFNSYIESKTTKKGRAYFTKPKKINADLYELVTKKGVIITKVIAINEIIEQTKQ